MRNNQKGFTLIELLVTIALMLSILGIAIVSFINISNRKKEETWGQVKDQVETAAIEYFNSNEYMFEGLGDGAFGRISVGTLVKNDYISRVVNPVTGEVVPSCAYVKVEKSGNKYKASFDEAGIMDSDGETACDTNDSVEVSVSNGAEFTIDQTCNWNNGDGTSDGENHDSDWCYQYGATPRIINLKGNKKDAKVGYCVSNEPMCTIEHFDDLYPNPDENPDEIRGYLDTKEGNGKYITVAINNGNGIRMRSSKIYSIDRTNPEGKITINSLNSKYNTYNANISMEARDAASGVTSVKFLTDVENDKEYFDKKPSANEWAKTLSSVDVSGSKSQNGINVVKPIIIKDVVGNTTTVNSNEYKIYKECTNTIKGDPKTNTGHCDCETSKQAITTITNLTDEYTGKSCGNDTSSVEQSCTPSGCTAKCPTFSYSGTKRNGYFVGDKVNITITPDNKNDTWEWFSNDVKTGKYVSWGKNTGTKTVNVSGEGNRKLKVIVTNSSGNSKTCYSNDIKIDRTAPNCPTFSYSGTKGENGWYKSKISIAIRPTSDTVAWKWYTNEKVANFDSWHLWGENYRGNQTKTLDDDGKRRGRVVVRDAAGNERLCTTSTFSIDKTAPTMSITYGPNRERCGYQNSIRTKYTARDGTSGLAIVKDFYGYDSSIPSASSSYWRNRSITSGAGSYSHDHNWGPTCTTSGTPGSGTCYKLKYYLKDRAGNVRTGMTSSCATFYRR